MQQGPQTGATCNIQHCWDLLASNTIWCESWTLSFWKSCWNSLKFDPIASSRFLLSTTTEGVITTRSNRMKFRLLLKGFLLNFEMKVFASICREKKLVRRSHLSLSEAPTGYPPKNSSSPSPPRTQRAHCGGEGHSHSVNIRPEVVFSSLASVISQKPSVVT